MISTRCILFFHHHGVKKKKKNHTLNHRKSSIVYLPTFKKLPFRDFSENIESVLKIPCHQALFLEELNCACKISLAHKGTTLQDYPVSLGGGTAIINCLNLHHLEAYNSYCHMISTAKLHCYGNSTCMGAKYKR